MGRKRKVQRSEEIEKKIERKKIKMQNREKMRVKDGGWQKGKGGKGRETHRQKTREMKERKPIMR